MNSKAASIDVEKLLCPFDGSNTKEIQQNHNLEHGFDLTNLYEVTKPYIAEGRRYTGSFTVNNEQRDVGVITGSEISKQYGEAGLPENTINVYTNGHAGQSLAAYAPKGLMIHHTGDANDYVGKDYLVVRSLSKHLLKNDKMKLLLVTSHSMVRQVVRHLLTVVQEKDSVLEIVV